MKTRTMLLIVGAAALYYLTRKREIGGASNYVATHLPVQVPGDTPPVWSPPQFGVGSPVPW